MTIPASTTTPAPTARPGGAPSPWPGSRHATRHRWQLDGVGSLAEAAVLLRALADELTAASAAGWSLQEPVRNGHLLAVRASRRERARLGVAAAPPADVARPQPAPLRWRLRVVDEPPVPGDRVLALGGPASARTPVLRSEGTVLRQVGGPPVDAAVLDELARQLADGGPTTPRPATTWAVASARVGPGVDLVADGSALRVHALRDGALVRTVEVLTFLHAADGATTLPLAAAAYARLAAAADAMASAGARLTGTDDGLLHVAHPDA